MATNDPNVGRCQMSDQPPSVRTQGFARAIRSGLVVTMAIHLSCGGQRVHSRTDAGDAGNKDLATERDSTEALACQGSPDAQEPDTPSFIDFDHGVPLDQVPFALAAARCNYWSGCTHLAPYVVGQCIEALSHTGAWHFTACTEDILRNGQLTGYHLQCAGETIRFGYPQLCTSSGSSKRGCPIRPRTNARLFPGAAGAELSRR